MGKQRYKRVGKSDKDPEMLFKNRFNTRLDKKERVEFRKWVREESAKQDRDIMMDKGTYDVQGYWKNDRTLDSRGHGSDKWKKPNHPKFSDESIYAGRAGNPGGKWNNEAFIPSQQTLDLYGEEGLQRYFIPTEKERLEIKNTKDMKGKRKIKKYLTGTKVSNAIPNPLQDIEQNRINVAKAQYESSTNFWTNLLDGIGMTGLTVAANMAGGITAGGGLGPAPDAPGVPDENKKTGGKICGNYAEVEGGEWYEKPNGESGEFDAPSHKQGGKVIPIGEGLNEIPEGTEIYSAFLMDEVKNEKTGEIKQVSYADKKGKRETRLKKVEKRMKDNPVDSAIKNAYERTVAQVEKEDVEDREKQSAQKFMYDYLSKSGQIDKQSFGKGGKIGFTAGDILGMAGTLESFLGPMLMTQKNRAEDTPYPEFARNQGVGNKGLEANQSAMELVARQQDNALNKVESGRQGAVRRNQNLRGMSQIQTANVGADIVANQGNTDIYDNFSKEMMQLYGIKGQLGDAQDLLFSQGAEKSYTENTMQRDNYSTQMAQNLASAGAAVQKLGADWNQQKLNNTILDIAKNSSKHGGNPLDGTYRKIIEDIGLESTPSEWKDLDVTEQDAFKKNEEAVADWRSAGITSWDEWFKKRGYKWLKKN